MKTTTLILTIFLTIIVFILVVVGFAYYEYRQEITRERTIKSECHSEAKQNAIKKGEREAPGEGMFRFSDYETYFDLCLNNKGL